MAEVITCGLNIVDNFKRAIRRAGRNKGVAVGFSFMKGAYDEFARVKLKAGIEIILKIVDTILKETFPCPLT